MVENCSERIAREMEVISFVVQPENSIYFALNGHSFDHEKSRILPFAVEFIDERILCRFEMLVQLLGIVFKHTVVDG